MAVSLRLVRARVKSIKNTKKITKAMEMVSAAKMRKAVQATLASRAYSLALRDMVRDVSVKIASGSIHSLMQARNEVKRVAVIVFSSDRGLCGSYNAQIVRLANHEIQARLAAGKEVTLMAVGKRGAAALKSRGIAAHELFTDLSTAPTAAQIRPLSKSVVDGFLRGDFDEVWIAYTKFGSALVQYPKFEQLLPLAKPEKQHEVRGEREDQEVFSEYIFEPNPEDILNMVVPRLLETLVYQALLESNASEHSARMMNMQNATRNAGDMIDDFTLMMNQIRQAGITREISEISAGKAALE